VRALAQFQRTIVASDSRWDRSQRGELELSADEAAGETVFERHCASCHTPPLFTDGDFHNNGLDARFPEDPLDVGRGRARVTGETRDLGKFKTPTLRNVALSAPYMHDGRFKALRDVLDHYRVGMVASPSVDPDFVRDDGAIAVPLSNEETRTLELFLRTLTDTELPARYGPPKPPCST
jgi:cytochrome c peroxidase